ncbi:MAG: protein kinase [Acidobacteriota bacterium]
MFGKPGQTIDQYVLLMLIRQDSLSELWLAREGFPGGREALIKLFPTDYPGSPYFKRESAAISRFDERFVFSPKASGYAVGCDYFALELVAWRTLREIIKESRNGMSLDAAMPVMVGLFDALEHIHSRQVVHRDLKPDNIYVMEDGQVKIVDFASSLVRSLTEPVAMQFGNGENALAGAPVYFAPEQFEGESQEDERTDFYHAGAVMFEMLTTRAPFEFESATELMNAHISAPLPSLASARPDLPEAMDQFFRRLMAKRKENRFETASEARSWLLRAAAGETVPGVVEEIETIPAVEETPAQTEPLFCSRCGTKMEAETGSQEVCRNCQAEMIAESEMVSCRVCGARMPSDARFCEHCGFEKTVPNLESAEPKAAAESEPVIEAQSQAVEYAAQAVPLADDWVGLTTEAVFGKNSFIGGSSSTTDSDSSASFASSTGASPARSPRSSEESQVFESGAMFDNRYRVEKLIGQGGFANIYLVTDTTSYLHQELVLKVPLGHHATDEIARKLRHQLKVWKLLSDAAPEAVVRLLKVERIASRGESAVGIFMEYMSGGSLARMVADGWNGCPHTQEQLARLMRLFLQVSRSIQVLHSRGYIHRDIKPGNFLLDSSGTLCKMSDFELVARADAFTRAPGEITGTPAYMAPECFDGRYSVSTDIFALGATLYHLLCGALPFRLEANKPVANERPVDLSSRNPIVPPELGQVVMRCLDAESRNRPASVADIIGDIERLGLAEEGTSAAPLNLARLLLAHLSEEDLDYLEQSLETGGFRSSREQTHDRRADLIEEYCYTAPPDEVLAQNCTVRQLAAMAKALGINAADAAGRDTLIDAILEAAGFLSGPRQVPGLEATLGHLQSQLLELANASSSDECLGIVHSSLAAVERAITLLVRFYGSLLYGAGLESFLSRGGKSSERLTLDEKLGALKELCLSPPDVPIPRRVEETFQWPIIASDIFKRFDELASERDQLADQAESSGLPAMQRLGRKVISSAIDVMTDMARNPYSPRVVQIVARQDDVYGRHFYTGQDDRGRSERIFTPLPLDVGQMYLFYPMTNPARINPLIFPYDSSRKQR